MRYILALLTVLAQCSWTTLGSYILDPVSNMGCLNDKEKCWTTLSGGGVQGDPRMKKKFAKCWAKSLLNPDQNEANAERVGCALGVLIVLTRQQCAAGAKKPCDNLCRADLRPPNLHWKNCEDYCAGTCKDILKLT